MLEHPASTQHTLSAEVLRVPWQVQPGFLQAARVDNEHAGIERYLQPVGRPVAPGIDPATAGG